MKKIFKKYLWLWEFIAVAFLIAVGIVAKVIPNILIIIIGIAFIVFGIFRIIPLLKTTGDNVLKWLYSGEILISIIAGIALVVLYNQQKDINKIFGYLIGGVFYLRALIFFFATTLRNEETDPFQFLLHILFITLGSSIIALGGFNAEDLGWVILFVAILTALFIGFSGYNHYCNYRNEKAAIAITKKLKQDEHEPFLDDIKHHPEIEKSKKDEIELR